MAHITETEGDDDDDDEVFHDLEPSSETKIPWGVLSCVAEDAGRLDKVLASSSVAEEASLTRSRLKALILEGRVLVDGVTCEDPSHKVTPNTRFVIDVPAPVPSVPVAENIPLDIVFEDDDLLVLNKPAGLVVHPGAGNSSGTLVNALLHHCGESLSGIGGVRRPGIVHRLDKDTSGLMMVAKNDFTHQGLSAQLQDRTLSRTYQALVWKPVLPIKGIIRAPIGRHMQNRLKMAVRSHAMGRDASTHYLREDLFHDVVSWVTCHLETGRTHQIRVHMQHIGHPLLGDPLYGLPQQEQKALLRKGGYEEEDVSFVLSFPRQALHAGEIAFIHPRSGEDVSFEVDWPEDFGRIFSVLNQ